MDSLLFFVGLGFKFGFIDGFDGNELEILGLLHTIFKK